MPSNSETVKWATAFSNRDSQETQKKVSVLTRELNNNHQCMENPATTTYESQGSSTGKPIISLKGKMLDFNDMHLQGKPFF